MRVCVVLSEFDAFSASKCDHASSPSGIWRANGHIRKGEASLALVRRNIEEAGGIGGRQLGYRFELTADLA